MINAIGNAFTIISGEGAGIWTASAVNLHLITGLPIGTYIMAFGIFNIIANQLLIRHFDWLRLCEEFSYILCFSYLIDLVTNLFHHWHFQDASVGVRIMMALFGVTLFCIGISLYQRANLFMHPNDDMSNILRFKYCHHSAVLSQFLDMAIPILILIACASYQGRIYAVNIGTVYSFLGNGVLIGLADRIICPRLVHNFNARDRVH
ncbi:hypothetical protein MOO44_04700 [Nicoliella spurrieriana]|uniref:Uncharacterized protein n=1 Tax=Nicoliella spurrieriana TaxID=2925830 RepID=A0A976RTC0_9LACO|nr:hypothetical protein [Nicoliella spurrieriana]UQS87457.1 hypothetical protein MOO44_04700 [Nicoliella spurrieriana]